LISHVVLVFFRNLFHIVGESRPLRWKCRITSFEVIVAECFFRHLTRRKIWSRTSFNARDHSGLWQICKVFSRTPQV
jgi:hypothetical protein